MRLDFAWKTCVFLTGIAQGGISILMTLFSPLLKLSHSKWILSYRLRRNWKNHLHFRGQAPSSNPLVKTFWIHAASGEIEYAKPLLRELRKRHPSSYFVVTYTSISGQDFQADLRDIDASCPLPLEVGGDLQEFLDLFSPQIQIISRTDLWPLVLDACFRRNIPVYLFAVTQSKPLDFGFKRFLFNSLSGISFVSEKDALNAGQLKTEIFIDGDPRYDQVFWRLQNKKEILPLKEHLTPSEFTVVLGSVWKEDLEILASSLKSLEASWIIVPHEWSKEMEEVVATILQGISWKKYSQLSSSFEKTSPLVSVIVVDQKGILAEVYEHGEAAFVGGSFRRKVHSVMEPLAWGKPVLVGPFHKNNREALTYSSHAWNKLPLVQVVSSAEEFAAKVRQLRSEPPLKNYILEELRTQQGATKKIADHIEALLI